VKKIYNSIQYRSFAEELDNSNKFSYKYTLPKRTNRLGKKNKHGIK
jgi:hypothetical protein